MGDAFSQLWSGPVTTLAIGTGITISLAVCSLVLGLFLAFLLTLWESVKCKAVSFVATAFVTLLRGLPEVLVVMFVYFGLMTAFAHLADGITINLGVTELHLQTSWESYSFVCGVIALSLIYAAYASQTLRGAIKAIPAGQWESGDALGLPKSAIFFRLIMPQMWRHALPGLGNQWLVLLKDTALVSLISVSDLMGETKGIVTSFGREEPFTWYLIAAFIYLLISIFSQFVLKKFELKVNHYTRKMS